jgi:hypothetical protein
MRPQVIKLSSATSSAWVPLDYKQSPFNVGLGLTFTGTATAKVEHTFDDIFDSSITPVAIPHSVLVAISSDTDSNYNFPVRAIRLTTTAWTSGTVTLTALQGNR